jgi:hypothetical protein
VLIDVASFLVAAVLIAMIAASGEVEHVAAGAADAARSA